MSYCSFHFQKLVGKRKGLILNSLSSIMINWLMLKMLDFFIVGSSKLFFFYSMYFDPLKSRSDVNFCRPKPDTLDNPKHPDYRGFRCRLTKIDAGLRFYWSNNLWIISHQSVKFPLSRKFRVDNSECHAIKNERFETILKVW